MKHFALICLLSLTIFSCSEKQEEPLMQSKIDIEVLKTRYESFTPVEIYADLSNLDERQMKVIELLTKAGHLADSIFWKQIAPDAIATRENLKLRNDEEGKLLYKYAMINFGPYDDIFEGERFVGDGPSRKPVGANLYPADLTKEEIEKYIENNPQEKDALMNMYSIVVRDGAKLKAIPYYEAYSEVKQMAELLNEAANYCDEPTLKNYLLLRAKALMTGDYFESDMAWMDVRTSDIDLVLGPIESYEDGILGQRTSFEAVIMVKDKEATLELKLFEDNILNFEKNLPSKPQYIRDAVGSDNMLQVVNVVYFGGDCQKGVKTIAASLPNDPKVHAAKGGKKSMYKNMMEAKFAKIVKPIGLQILDPSLHNFIDGKAFTSFVTLHEVSHTLGRGYVFGNDNLKVTEALKERYSALEECKADIVGMYNINTMFKMGLIDQNYLEQSKATFVAGLYRSIRFGTGNSHGRANLIQLNYLKEKGAIFKTQDGRLNINHDTFFAGVAELAAEVLNIQAEGDYEAAGNMLDKYAVVTDEIKADIEKLKSIPRDLNTTYRY